jgi:hypothetical protein
MTRPTNRPASSGWPVYERSLLSSVLGLPGYAAIAIALGFTGLGVFIDLNRINGLGTIFKGCYFAGCVLAVCWVKRRALFGPIVQPPLLLAVAVPSVVLISSGGGGSGGSGGLADHLLSIGAPLLNGFPTMATATAFSLAIGLARYLLQRPAKATPTARPRRGRSSTARSAPSAHSPAPSAHSPAPSAHSPAPSAHSPAPSAHSSAPRSSERPPGLSPAPGNRPASNWPPPPDAPRRSGRSYPGERPPLPNDRAPGGHARQADPRAPERPGRRPSSSQR